MCKPFVILFVFLHATNAIYSQTINTIAGNSLGGYSGDGVAATSTSLNKMDGIMYDATGNLYISDHDNHRIRKVSTSGIITTIAGTGIAGFSGDGGVATMAKINTPGDLFVDNLNNVFFADASNHCVRKITPSGIITTVAGIGGASGFSGDGGAATAAKLHNPIGVFIDYLGNMFIADQQNHRIRKVSPSGNISTYAGTGTIGYTGDGGMATAATMSFPNYVHATSSGTLYFTDNGNHSIRKINTTGIITTVAGTGTSGFSGDGGPATIAKLFYPAGITTTSSGDLYIADYNNHRVRVVNTAGIISTLAGTGVAGFSGDGGPATIAKVNLPIDVVFNSTGELLIADYNNNRIRKVGGIVTNSAPFFTKGVSQSFVLCVSESVPSSPVDTFLSVTDFDLSQTLTWGIVTYPSHGTLAGAYTTTTTGSTVTPSTYTYTPSAGYIGADMFKVSVNDGSANDTITVNVTVNTPPTAGTISGIDSVCPGDTLIFSETVVGGVWSSGSTAIATVSSTGIVTAIIPGTSTISYTVTNICGTATATHPVIVKGFSECTSNTADITRHEQVFVYPNPNNGTCNVTINTSAKNAQLTVIDVFGRVVEEMFVAKSSNINLALDLPNGVYQIRFAFDNQVLTSKLIVNK